MRTVHKFTLEISAITVLHMPANAKVVHVAVQNEHVCLWAYVDLNLSAETRCFKVYGTGHSIDGDIKGHIGTCLTSDGRFVWHVFEITK